MLYVVRGDDVHDDDVDNDRNYDNDEDDDGDDDDDDDGDDDVTRRGSCFCVETAILDPSEHTIDRNRSDCTHSDRNQARQVATRPHMSSLSTFLQRICMAHNGHKVEASSKS